MNRSAVSASTLLGILFVALKLLDKIDWSWWLVTMPFWLVPAVLLIIAGIAGLVALAVAAWSR